MDRFYQAIGFMEDNLEQPINIAQIASACHYSTFHFSRKFKAVVGLSAKQYLTRRRLSCIAEDICRGARLAEVAVKFGYTSQSAMTRALKDYCGLTAKEIKQQGVGVLVKQRLWQPRFSPSEFNNLVKQLDVQPKIVTQKARRLATVAHDYDGEYIDLMSLWQSFKPFESLVAGPNPAAAFGIYQDTATTNAPSQFRYHCAMALAPGQAIPAGMNELVIPARTLAVFRHQGPQQDLHHTLRFVWGHWLPNSPYQFKDGFELELYTQGKDYLSTKVADIDIALPINRLT